MPRKKVDERVRTLIENSVALRHRGMIVVVGDHGRDQVPNLHYIMAKCAVKARPSVLWCYKKDLGFSTHRKKRAKKIKQDIARGLHEADEEDPFDLFVSSTLIRWCYYKETQARRRASKPVNVFGLFCLFASLARGDAIRRMHVR